MDSAVVTTLDAQGSADVTQATQVMAGEEEEQRVEKEQEEEEGDEGHHSEWSARLEGAAVSSAALSVSSHGTLYDNTSHGSVSDMTSVATLEDRIGGMCGTAGGTAGLA